ncbi:MAG: recombinase family protein [Candidatus Dormibacteria bacterium]
MTTAVLTARRQVTPTRAPIAALAATRSGSTLLYARLSDDRNDGQGVPRQLEDCWQMVGGRGWDVDPERDVYVDDGFSASRRARKRRPRFDAMLDRIAAGGVARVVVWATDRLYRDPRDLLRLTDFAVRGIEVVTVVGGDLDLNTPDGVMRAGIMVYVAQREADGVSMRVRRQKRQRREQGLPHGGRLPFGWRDLMTPDPDEAALLREAMAAVIRGATLYDLANRWNQAGVRRHRGSSPWTGSDIKHLLMAPRHAGLVVENGQVAVDAEGREITAAWPAIVDQETWEMCASVLAARATGASVPRRRSWLTGVVRCGACGAGMTRSTNGRERRIWRCWSGRGGCGKVSIGAVPVEAVVEEALFTYVDGDELRSALAARDDSRVVAIRAQLAQADSRLRDLVVEFRGGESARAFRLASEGLETDRRRLEVELGRASARSPLEDFGDAPGALRAAWPAMTTDQRRSVVLAAFGAVTVRPATGSGRRFDPGRVSFGVQPVS